MKQHDSDGLITDLLDALHTLVASAESGDLPSSAVLDYVREVIAKAESTN